MHYVPLLNGEVGYRKEFSNDVEYSFVYVGGQHFARVDGVIGGAGKKYYYHNDHLGSALVVTDEDGNIVVERDFTPFGERTNVDLYDETNRDPAEDDSGFTGKDWDADIELYYFNARWYDPEIGRFISQDSAEDDPTLYVYGFNNPMKFVDPSGYWNVNINWTSVLTTTISHISPQASEILFAYSSFRGFIGTINNIQWANFLKQYTKMDEEGFKRYLESIGINYQFMENNTTNYVFTNTEGQKSLKQSSFGSILQKTLIGDQKLAYFHAMEGNIKAFLENNPGLSLEQVKGIFDSAVISADKDWGFGKNEFRYEGRGSDYAGLYGAEAVVMNEGMVLGVFTRASTLPDPEYIGGTIKEGVYDYVIGIHPMDSNRPVSEPVANATSSTYSGTQYIAPNLYYNGSRILPTEYPNDKHGGLYIMEGGNSHAGFLSYMGKKGKGSEGCPVLYWPDYYDYISLYSYGEKGKYIILR